MTDGPPPPDVIAVSDVVRRGDDDRPLRRAGGAGELRRLRRGAYIDSRDYAAMDRDGRYRARIDAVIATRRVPVVLSHHSAALLWNLPVADGWPQSVHITEPGDSARRSRNGVVVHRRPLRRRELVDLEGVRITSLNRTLIDLATDATSRDAVVALDHALRGVPTGARRGLSGMVPTRPLTSREDVMSVLDASERIRGASRAARIVAFADPRAEFPLESWSRVVIHELGFPAPDLQHRFPRPVAGSRYADFWWEPERLIGECDGRVEYVQDGERSAEEQVWQDKLRENELRDLGTSLTRWTILDLRDPARLRARLLAAGLQPTRTSSAGGQRR